MDGRLRVRRHAEPFSFFLVLLPALKLWGLLLVDLFVWLRETLLEMEINYFRFYGMVWYGMVWYGMVWDWLIDWYICNKLVAKSNDGRDCYLKYVVCRCPDSALTENSVDGMGWNTLHMQLHTHDEKEVWSRTYVNKSSIFLMSIVLLAPLGAFTPYYAFIHDLIHSC